ncbi:hypothetical protein D2T29_21925 [Sinirhodobacter populi]|uniref:Uncharacterized protein n=1 Tax=Paenirhodobacter populi TaxID=2306993 RepID=A0A443JYG5_9RHOB|nr:plasmid recombination protein [Sinirhodobacter populi]RWR25515.1 hypothetical protein D2T29_21925 [Sinirhodobacter populi]
MFKAAVRVNKITSIAQLRGATLHAQRADETSRARLRENAEPCAGLDWSKDANPRDYLAAFKAHKTELGAKERKNAPLCMQALCVVSPEWVRGAGDLHDPDNPRNRALFDQAKAWAESWAGKGAVFATRLDLDEDGGAVVDLMISPVRDSRGKPVISTQKALVELKSATGERNEYSALQTSWADWAREHLDASMERGIRKEITSRQHLSPETYGLVKDQARAEAAQERDQAPDLYQTLRSASELPEGTIEGLRDYLLLQREAQAHKRDPRGYEPPQDPHWTLDDTLELALDESRNPWPTIETVRRDAQKVLDAALRFGVGMDDDKGGYEAGRAFFPALADRMHLTAAIAKCADFCARAEAFVKNTLARMQGREEIYLDHGNLWPRNAPQAVERNERNLGLRAPVPTAEREWPASPLERQKARAHTRQAEHEAEPVREKPQEPVRERERDRDDGLDL